MTELKVLTGGKLPNVHKLGKWLLSGIAGLAASALVEQAYDGAYWKHRQKKAS